MILSIIIPHYNSPMLLGKLLDSIPNIPEIQTIVVDDNSDRQLDQYRLLQSEAKYRNVRFAQNTTGYKGAGACRNLGLSMAEGDWLLFADADDYFIKGFYDVVKSYFTSDNDVVFFIPTSIELDTGRVSHRHVPNERITKAYLHNRDIESETKLRYRMFVPWSKLIRKELVDRNNIRFDHTIASNDVMFSVKVGYHMNKFEVADSRIYCVTRSKGTLTMNTSIEVFNARVAVRIKYCHFLNEHLKPEALRFIKLSGREFLPIAIKNKIGIRETIHVYKTFRRNNIPVFDLDILNPIFIFRKILFHYYDKKKNDRYYSK